MIFCLCSVALPRRIHPPPQDNITLPARRPCSAQVPPPDTEIWVDEETWYKNQGPSPSPPAPGLAIVHKFICYSCKKTKLKMRWELVASFIASVAGVSAQSGPAIRNLNGRNIHVPPQARSHPGVPFDKWTRDGPVAKKFQNANTKSMPRTPPRSDMSHAG